MEKEKTLGLLDNKYPLKKVLGSGGTSSVFLSTMNCGEAGESTQEIAIKVINVKNSTMAASEEKFLRAEYDSMSQLDNPNIIKVFDIGRGNLVSDQGIKENMPYIVLEYAQKGDLFNYMFTSNKEGIEEPYSRAIFKQLLNAVQACHSNGFCHRDIKLENIMFDKDYILKLCDFGFAAKIEGHNNDGLLRTPCGTTIYKAPELLVRSPYEGIKSDIFALGVTLFGMVSGKVPFGKASRDDPSYKFIGQRRYNLFWERMNRNNVFPNGISNELKTLFEKMVSYDPRERPSVDQILIDPWFSLNTATKDELIAELKDREAHVKTEEVNVSSSVEESEEDSEMVYRGNQGDNIQYFNKEHKIYKEKFLLQKVNCIILKGKKNPWEIFNDYANIVSKNKNMIVNCDKKKLKFKVTLNNEEVEEGAAEDKEKRTEEVENEDQVLISVRLNFIDENSYFINYQKKSGNYFDYLKLIKELKDLAKNL